MTDAHTTGRTYTEADLREAFKAGWKERNRTPGLKRVARSNLNNLVLGAIGGGRYADMALIPDNRTYTHSIWLRSAFRKANTPNAGERGSSPIGQNDQPGLAFSGAGEP